jgi:Ca2+-binding EF-hand superfamily protein
MLTRKLAAAFVVAAATAVSGAPAFAQEGTQDDFMILFKMTMMDKNKDGMVSKKEFIAMMDKAYDMKAKSMGAKGGLMTEAQMREFLKSLYTGG